MIQTRIGATLAVACLLLAVTAGQALASHGSGGGGGGGGTTTTAPPASAPVVSFSQSTVTFGPQALGTTSPAQTVTLTNTGTAALFVNFVGQSGLGTLDYTITNDQCIGTFTAPGASCTMTLTFTPHATGARTATISLTDNATNSPQGITLNGTGTSVDGPTPLSINTTGLTCNAGVCDLTSGSTSLVNDFYYTRLSAQGDTVAPFTWTLVGGALPPGIALFSDGELYGTPTATGVSTFTVQVTDANGQTATEPLSLTVSPTPPPLTPLQQSCQHAPSQTTANLAGAAIAGKTPSGQAIGDQSQLTACGGYTTIKASVKDVNLPNGTVLWVALGGRVIDRIVLNNGAATTAPLVTTQSLRQQGISVDTQPPSGDPTRVPALFGKFG